MICMDRLNKKELSFYAKFLNQLAKDLTKFYYLKLNKNKLLPPNNFEDSISQIGNDYWNEYIFSEILQSYEIDYKVIDYLEHSKKFFKYMSSINKRRELTIFQGYFPRLFSIVLAIFLQKNTVLSIFFKEMPNNNVVAFDRNKLNGIELTQSSEFEKFLNKQILNFIPLSNTPLSDKNCIT